MGLTHSHSLARCLAAGVLLLAAGTAAFGQGPPLLREAFSREVTVHAGGALIPTYGRIASREVALFIGGETLPPQRYLESRELDVVVTTPAPPAPITNLTVVGTILGDAATLNWAGYNPWIARDMLRYAVYVADRWFGSVTGMTPVAYVWSDVFSITLSGLTPWQSHYFAVVPVDAAGNFVPDVICRAIHPIGPEAISREVSLSLGGTSVPLYARVASREVAILVGGTSVPPDRQIVSREADFVVATAAFPPAIQTLTAEGNVTGERVALAWNYAPWLYHDVVRYDIYLEPRPFTSLSGKVTYASVHSEIFSVLFTNLPAWRDHYIAVIPVDALGGYDPNFTYVAVFSVSPKEVFTREYSVLTGGKPEYPRPTSREISIHVGGNPIPAYPRVESREVALFVGEPRVPWLQVASREISLARADASLPPPVTGLESGFRADTSVSAYSAIDLDWRSYDAGRVIDLLRYRIYLGQTYFESVTGMSPHAYVWADQQTHTLAGLNGGAIYYVAVVAEDVGGNFDPVVRSASVKASVEELGEVRELSVVCGHESLAFSWLPPEEAEAFLAHYNVYFAGAGTPTVLPPGTTNFFVGGLERAHGYSVRVTTTDVFGKESSGVSLLAATLLPNPANVRAAGFDQVVRLDWSHAEPTSQMKHYAVYISEQNFSSVAGMTPVVTTRGRRAYVEGLQNGRAYFFAVTTVNIANGEDPVVQTITATPNPVPGVFADLAVSAVSAPAQVNVGTAVTFDWMVMNLGGGATSREDLTPVEAWTDRIVLSRNSIFGDADDVTLAVWPRTGLLLPGGSYAATRTVTIPLDLQGAYYVFVQTDADDVVYEHLDYNGNERPAPSMMVVLNGAGDVVLVSGNGQPILDGQPEARVENGTAFGEVCLSAPGRVHSFSIQNTGAAPIELGENAVLLTGADATGFAILSQPAATLAPGDSTGFEFAFLPQAGRDYQAVVAIHCPVAEGGVFSFAVAGTGVMPSVTITNISFTAQGQPQLHWTSPCEGLLYTVEASTVLDPGSTNQWFIPGHGWPIQEHRWTHTNAPTSTNLFYRVRGRW